MSGSSPFQYFKTSPEIIRPTVVMYVRFPLSPRNAEDFLMRPHGRPERSVTDRLISFGAAFKDLGRGDDREMGRWANNRAENSPLRYRRRERAMLRFRRIPSLQTFAFMHASVCNHFNQERTLSNRENYRAAHAAAFVKWRGLFAA